MSATGFAFWLAWISQKLGPIFRFHREGEDKEKAPDMGAGHSPAVSPLASGGASLPQAKATAPRMPKLAIVVGHDSTEPGAFGVSPIGMCEYPWNKEIARIMVGYANELGVDAAVFLRDGVGIVGAYKNVKAWPPDCVIELHFNAYNGKVRGTETLYAYDESREFGQIIQEEMANLFGRYGSTDRGLKKVGPMESGHVNTIQLKKTGIPSILVEPFFGDVHAEANMGQRLINPYAERLIIGVLQWWSQEHGLPGQRRKEMGLS